MSQKALLEEVERKVGGTGGSVAVYIPKEIKMHYKAGEPIFVGAEIKGKDLVIVVRKLLFKFDFKDIKNLAEGFGLTKKEDKIIGDVQIFQAEKNNVSLSFTKNLLEKLSPAYATVSLKKLDINYDGYSNILEMSKKLKKEFDVITLPEGDLDTINLLKDPKRYKLTEKKAIGSLRKSGRKVGVSVTVRFNSMKNTLDQITLALSKLS